MRRILVLLIVATMLALGCGGSEAGAEGSADAEVELSALDELKAVSTDLQAGIDDLMQPINDTDAVIDQITSMPARLGISAPEFMAMCKATMDTGQVSISADLNMAAEVKAEVEAVLVKLQGIVTGLQETPSKVQALGAAAAAATAKVPALAAKVTTGAQAKIAMPMASAESKAQAQADLNAVAGVQAEVEAKIAEIQQKVGEIPAMATSALAKLTASFAAGT